MFSTIKKLLALIRFSHTVFALPFALLAAVMAWRVRALEEFVLRRIASGESKTDAALDLLMDLVLNVMAKALGGDHDLFPRGFSVRWQELLGILLCMIFARSAAMAFNRMADRTIDAANPRTAKRHLPLGDLSVPQVVAFAFLCSACFVASTLWFLPNWLPLYLAIPVLVFLFGYSLTKRFTVLSHFWLGTALALSPVAAWIAIRGEAVMSDPTDLLPAVVLGLAVLTWVAGFDIIYACQDADFDRDAKLHSIPVRIGVTAALRLAAACHLATILALAALPFVFPAFGMIYWIGIAVVTALLLYEHAIVRPDDLTRVNIAFFQVNGVISLGLFAVGTLDLWLGW